MPSFKDASQELLELRAYAQKIAHQVAESRGYRPGMEPLPRGSAMGLDGKDIFYKERSIVEVATHQIADQLVEAKKSLSSGEAAKTTNSFTHQGSLEEGEVLPDAGGGQWQRVDDVAPFTVLEVQEDFVGFLIGMAGSRIKQVQMESGGAEITCGMLSVNGKRKVCIGGSPDCQQKAKQIIEGLVQQRMLEETDFVTEFMEVPGFFAGLVLGKKAEFIRKVKEMNNLREASIDQPSEEQPGASRFVKLRGTPQAVAMAKLQFERRLLDNQRKRGIFNIELENKFAQIGEIPMPVLSYMEGSGPRYVPSTAEVPAGPQPVTTQQAPAMPYADPGASTTVLAEEPWPQNVVDWAQAQSQFEAALEDLTISELTAWANFYAGDPECVAYFEMIMAASRAICQEPMTA